MRVLLGTILVLLLMPGIALAQVREDFDPAEPFVSDPQPLHPPQIPGAVLWDNGPLATCTGCGSGGADESMLQSVSFGMNTLGWGHQVVNDNRVADDFEITDPAGWDIEKITFFAYQTGSPTTSTITAVNLQIWDGPPGGGGTVIFGDPTTDLLSATDWSNIYRTSETSIGSTLRPIMYDEVEFAPAIHLDPGTYWLDWQTDGTLGSGPWAPPVTILGNPSTGDGLQSLDDGVTWAPVLDTGNGLPQGFPFIIEGDIPVPTTPPLGFALLALALLALGYLALAHRRRRA